MRTTGRVVHEGEGRRASQYCQICKKVDQKSAVLKESLPQYFLSPCCLEIIVDQLVKTPPPLQQTVSRRITDHRVQSKYQKRMVESSALNTKVV